MVLVSEIVSNTYSNSRCNYFRYRGCCYCNCSKYRQQLPSQLLQIPMAIRIEQYQYLWRLSLQSSEIKISMPMSIAIGLISNTNDDCYCNYFKCRDELQLQLFQMPMIIAIIINLKCRWHLPLLLFQISMTIAIVIISNTDGNFHCNYYKYRCQYDYF